MYFVTLRFLDLNSELVGSPGKSNSFLKSEFCNRQKNRQIECKQTFTIFFWCFGSFVTLFLSKTCWVTWYLEIIQTFLNQNFVNVKKIVKLNINKIHDVFRDSEIFGSKFRTCWVTWRWKSNSKFASHSSFLMSEYLLEHFWRNLKLWLIL